MNIHAAAHYMRTGYRITRSNFYVNCTQNWIDNITIIFWSLHLDDLLADDWEIDRRDLVDDSGMVPIYKEPPSDIFISIQSFF